MHVPLLRIAVRELTCQEWPERRRPAPLLTRGIALVPLLLPSMVQADTLAQLVTAALEAHPAVLAQRAHVSAARAQRQAALSGLGQTLGHPVDSQSLASEIAAPRELGVDPADLLDKALAIHPAFRKARAEARTPTRQASQ